MGACRSFKDLRKNNPLNAAERKWSMYAVIRTGGKQYRVTAGDILEVEKLSGAVGDTVTLDDVLMVSNDEDVTVGQPVVDGASVTAKITGQYRGKKIMVFRYRPKKRIRVRRGHRQYLTRLEIESITAHGETHARSVAQETTPVVTEEEPVESASVDETIVAAGAEETAMGEAQADEAILDPAPDADETNVATQEDVDSAADSGESSSEDTGTDDTDAEDSVVDNSDSEDTDSDQEDKE